MEDLNIELETIEELEEKTAPGETTVSGLPPVDLKRH